MVGPVCKQKGRAGVKRIFLGAKLNLEHGQQHQSLNDTSFDSFNVLNVFLHEMDVK